MMQQRDTVGAPPRRAIGSRRLKWLSTELEDWRAAGLIEPATVPAILQRYESAEQIKRHRMFRVYATLCGLAALLFAAGVAMLVGHNWHVLTREVKVVGIFAMVIGAFGVSVWAYRTDHPTAGEVAALLGTLFYGCAIWLLAQVFQIEAHYPDGFMWWMIGTLIVAGLLNSRMITIAAVIELAMWTSSQQGGFAHPNYLFLPYAAILLVLGYRMKSVTITAMTALAGALWLLLACSVSWPMDERTVAPIMMLLGCTYYAAGTRHGTASSFGRTWQIVGLCILLIALVPMTFTDYFRWGYDHAASGAITAGVLTAAMVLLGFVRRDALDRLREDWLIVLTAAAGLGLMVLLRYWPVVMDRGDAWAPVIAASVVSVMLSIWLIVRGVHMDRALSFFAGVSYLLLFVLVRWVDMVGDMVGTALIFFIVAAALAGAAWFWRHRHTLESKAMEVTHA